MVASTRERIRTNFFALRESLLGQIRPCSRIPRASSNNVLSRRAIRTSSLCFFEDRKVYGRRRHHVIEFHGHHCASERVHRGGNCASEACTGEGCASERSQSENSFGALFATTHRLDEENRHRRHHRSGETNPAAHSSPCDPRSSRRPPSASIQRAAPTNRAP